MAEGTRPDSAIVMAAQTIRSELPALLDGGEAARVESALIDLLTRAKAAHDAVARAQAEDRILELLAAHQRTRERMDELLPTPDEERGVGSAFEPLPGGGEPIDADWYGCPQGDYDWPVFAADEPIPQCPTHHVALVPKQRT
jgi:hypothetical protein